MALSPNTKHALRISLGLHAGNEMINAIDGFADTLSALSTPAEPAPVSEPSATAPAPAPAVAPPAPATPSPANPSPVLATPARPAGAKATAKPVTHEADLSHLDAPA